MPATTPHAASDLIRLVHPFGDYSGPALSAPRPPSGQVLVAEYTLRTAEDLLKDRPQEDCDIVAEQLLAAVGPSPRALRSEPEPAPRFWPVDQAHLERAIRLLDAHGGSVSEAVARQFERCIAANRH